MENQIFKTKECKSLLDENKIDEAKKMINNNFFKGMGDSIFIYNPREKKFMNIKFKDLSGYLPNDLNNKTYKSNLSYKERINVDTFDVMNYFKSSEFYDISNVCIPTIDFSEESLIFYKNNNKYLNLKEPLPFNNEDLTKVDLKNYTNEINLINKHLYEVLCSSNKEMYEYFLNFIAFSFAGVKVRTCIYLQSPERTGKGIYLNFINQCLGKRFFKTSSNETISTYTKDFEGRTLINFDELPEAGNNKSIQDKLKGLITEPTFDCRKMYQNGYTQKNTFNCIISTNNNAVRLTATNNKRYPCPDISEHRIGDNKYFDKLNKAMNKPNVNIAYYKFMIQQYEKNKHFNFDIMPTSNARTEKLALSMPLICKYIKKEYLLKGCDFKIKVSTFIKNFNDYYKKDLDGPTIGRNLSEHLKIQSKIIKKNRYYIVTHSELLDKYKAKKWFVEEFDFIENEEDDNQFDDTEYTREQELINDQSKRIKEQAEEIERLKKQIKKLTEAPIPEYEPKLKAEEEYKKILQENETLNKIKSETKPKKNLQDDFNEYAFDDEPETKPKNKPKTNKIISPFEDNTILKQIKRKIPPKKIIDDDFDF